MLMPSIFGENFLDDFFDYPMTGGYDTANLMHTDVRETDAGYEVTMDIPGVRKEDVTAELKDGYLTIQASANSDREEKDEDGRYIRRERYTGTSSRSFYVGEDVTEDDIRARFEDGTLRLMIPKKEPKPEVAQQRYIRIEG